MSDVLGQSGYALPEQLRQICAKTGREQVQQKTCAVCSLFDHLVGAAEQLCWHFEPERTGGSERVAQIDHPDGANSITS